MSNLADADRAHLEQDFVEAIRLYRSVLAQDPCRFEAWYGLASASGSRLEYADAIAAYRRALALRPHNTGVHLNLGSALFALGYVTEAVRNCQIAATATEPEVRAMALRNLACIAPGDSSLDNATILDIGERGPRSRLRISRLRERAARSRASASASPITARSSPTGTG